MDALFIYMNIEISVGEALDRLSILEIKMTELCAVKKSYVQKEIETLSGIMEYKTKFKYYYSLLFGVNKLIWDKTNIIKTMSIDNAFPFAVQAKAIFDLNQSRFRLKNVINKLCSSTIQEQKSYGLERIYVCIKNSSDIDIAKLTYLSLNFDVVQIVCDTDVFVHKVPPFNYEFSLNEDESYTNINEITVSEDFLPIVQYII